MAGHDDRKAAGRTELGGQDEEAQPDREMRYYQRGKEDALDRPLQRERVPVEHKSEGGADEKRYGRRPAGHDEAVAESSAEIVIGERLGEPAPGPRLGREGQD